MAEQLESSFHLHAGAHYVSAEYWERKARWTSYFTASAMGVTGASGGSLMAKAVSTNPKFRSLTFVTFGCSLLATGIQAVGRSNFNPDKMSDEHQKAAAQLKTLRRRLVKWKQTHVLNPTVPVATLDEEFDVILQERERIEVNTLTCESWTYAKALKLLDDRDSMMRQLINDGDSALI
ncbi:uncharacterized protein LOC144349553 [Saccoglossus kowalevskii]